MKYADAPNAADARRASVLVIHHRTSNTVGLTAVVEEAIAASRETELVLAVLDVHRQILVHLRTDSAIELIASQVRDFADHAESLSPQDGTDVRRAALLLDAHGRDDTAAINAVVQEAGNAGHGGQLVVALLNLYEHLIPEVSSTAGTEWLHRCVAAFSNEENQR